MPATEPNEYRLKTPLVPKHYAITLTASPKRAGFSGEVVLTGRVTARTRVLTLHARDLKVSQVTATQRKKASTGRARCDAARQTVTLSFEHELAVGPIALHLAMAGKLSGSMHGLYLAQDGPERAIVSQCEASDARAIFPCMDEPAHKATFAWTVHTDKGLTVLTNGKALKASAMRGKPGVMTHTFAPTRVMSTYLCAITIGAFEPGPTYNVGKVPCRTFAGLGKASQTAFASQVTADVLPWYAEYFGHPYNYGKLDQVAVPGFDAGAMENVGAIFYRQNLLLMQEGQTSWGAQKRIAEVVAHELAHQWFGNLVTMTWWDDLWLNEAFATWMAFTVCHALHPEWHIWDDYLEGKEAALIADALGSTHPIYNEVHNPAQATELFDVITYEKGCAVLRMCEHYLGARVFKAGIRRYIQAFANSNAEGQDLWDALSAAANKPVAELMHGWIHRPGHPVLTCKAAPAKSGTAVVLSQRQFLAQPKIDGGTPRAKAVPWMIPVVIAYDAGAGPKQHRVLMDAARMEVALPAGANASLRWVYVNHDATGFYRTQMAPKLQQKLLAHGLPHLSAGARMALVNDQWALTRAGEAQIDALMPLLIQLGKDEDPGVFRSVAGRLRALWSHVAADADLPALESLIRDVARPHLTRLGLTGDPGESPRTATRRATMVDLMGGVGADADVLAQAVKLAEAERRDPSCVDANVAASLVALAAKQGNDAYLRLVVTTYQKRKKEGMTPELTSRYLYALCAFERPSAIKKVLAMTLDGTIPQEQLRIILSALLSRRASGALAWTFIKRHWQDIGPRVGGMGVARLVESTGNLPYALQGDVARFFGKNPVPEAERALKKAMESFELWHALREQHSAALGQWLKRHR